MVLKLALFDFDGTLVDSLRDYHLIETQVIASLGGRVPDLQRFRRIIGEDKDWESFYRRFGIVDKEKSPEHIKKGTIGISHGVISGVKETLEELANRNVGLSIVSLNPHINKIILRLDGQLGDHFYRDNIYGASLNKVDALRRVCRRHEIFPREAVYIGDMAKDIRETKRAGLVSVGIANDFSYNHKDMLESANPDYLFDDIREVTKLF